MNFPFELQTQRQFDAAGFGLNAVDHLIVVPEYPAYDTKTRYLEHLQSAGGQTASAMVGLQRLGLRTAYAGRFGSDQEGTFGLESLRAEQIDITFCEQIPHARTQSAFILIDAKNGERTIVWDRDLKVAWPESDVPAPFAAIAPVLHIDGHDPFACLRLATDARAAGTIVTGDFDYVSDGVAEMLSYVDILVANRDFPPALTGISDRRKALSELHSKFGIPIVGMTLGEDGALVLFDDVFIESPAYPVPGGCRDTTGAGDAFHAGLIFGLVNGDSIEESLKLANATAALKCRALGARTALPTREELLSFIQTA